jgi:hypothetical protein
MAQRVALVIGIGLIKVLSRSLLDGDHGVIRCECSIVGRVLEFRIELIAGTFFRDLATICTLAKSCALFLFEVLLNIYVTKEVLV